MDDELKTSPDDDLPGPTPSVDSQAPGWQVAKQGIHAALFPAVGTERVKVGRFELQRRLGAGGMGEVYVAYDEHLDRQVALKLLLHGRSADPKARERLLREAQVLARLSHPNVVQIHEAGVHDDQVYLVMELVDGVTLREWLGQTPEGARVRPWAEVLPVMIEAGQGLAAAHAAGLTHRDFKPENVLVGHDGRVRVLDFGLARPAISMPVHVRSGSGMGEGPSMGSGSRRGIAPLTEAGQVMGTLAYMSPEQLTATPLDARSDQYGFCVVLYEALYGERPFNGSTFAAFAMAVTQGKLEEPATRSSVPRWLRALVRRGLSVAPDDRFADMQALLRELSRPHGRAWKVGLLAGVAALGSVSMASVLSPVEASPCEQADAELVERWNDEARARALEAFVAAEPSYGADAAQRVTAALDLSVQAWRAEQRDACEDTRVRESHPEELLARRTACIERNTATLRALLDALPGADAGLVEHALELAQALPEPVRCQDLDALGPDAPEDPEAVRGVREALAAVEVLRLAGREGEARTRADDSLARAEATSDGPVHAEALVEAARVRLVGPRPADHERAAELLWQALDLAELHEHRPLLFEIWIELLTVDQRFGRHAQARRWARRAEVALERSPGEPRRRLELALRRGVSELVAGDPEASERWLRQGLDEAAAQPGSRPMQARLLEGLGSTLRASARGEDAREAYAQAEQLWRSHLGPEHPYLALHAFNVGLLLAELGETDAARERLVHARDRWTALHGSKTSWVGRTELALAELDQATGALDDALEHATRGQDILRAALSPEDPLQVEALQMLGLVQFRRGQLQAAHDAWQQALERLLLERPASDPDVLRTRSNLAEALLGLSRHDEARAIYIELLPFVEARAEQDPLVLMLVRKGLGLAELGSGRPVEAVPQLRAALELLDRHGGPALERADLQWALARAELGTGAESRAGVRERAEQATELYAEHGQAERADQIRAWLAQLEP